MNHANATIDALERQVIMLSELNGQLAELLRLSRLEAADLRRVVEKYEQRRDREQVE